MAIKFKKRCCHKYPHILLFETHLKSGRFSCSTNAQGISNQQHNVLNGLEGFFFIIIQLQIKVQLLKLILQENNV